MLSVGIDAHHRLYAVCVMDETGKIVRERTIRGGVEDVAAWVGRLGRPARVCFEASLGYGRLHDALAGVATDVQVAHPGHLRAIFRCKRKNDRIDARKLARLALLDQVPKVHVPKKEAREWRRLIEHRRRQVDKRTRAKNAMRSLLRSEGIEAPRGSRLWTRKGMAWLRSLRLDSEMLTFTRDQHLLEIEHYDATVKAVTGLLDRKAERSAAVTLLRTIPGVGPRTAEVIAAYVADPDRFTSTRKAASYFGLVPSLDESAGVRRLGRITRQGPATARKMLVEATWQAIRRSPTLRTFYERVLGGRKNRKNRALVATAHQLLKAMVAMLKSGAVWEEKAAAPSG